MKWKKTHNLSATETFEEANYVITIARLKLEALFWTDPGLGHVFWTKNEKIYFFTSPFPSFFFTLLTQNS